MLENKYSRWYHGIVSQAQQRSAKGYVERHHIVPKSLGGSDDSSNRVALTSREHFVCHALLIRMTEGADRYKMLNALMKMKVQSPDHSEQRYINGRLFEAARLQHIAKLNDPVLDAERRKKISLAKTGVKRAPFSEQARKNMGLAATGRLHTDSYKAHMSSHKSQYWAAKKAAGETYPMRECSHCRVSGRGPNMSRYHFDNCKERA